MEYLKQIEKMLDSGHRIITIESLECDRVCDFLLELSRISSNSFYLAAPGEGMHRLGASHITIPRTQTAEDIMEHIEASHHFGYFILRDFDKILKDEDLIEDLLSIATSTTNKVVIFISQNIDLPDLLKPYTMRSKHKMKDAV